MSKDAIGSQDVTLRFQLEVVFSTSTTVVIFEHLRFLQKIFTSRVNFSMSNLSSQRPLIILFTSAVKPCSLDPLFNYDFHYLSPYVVFSGFLGLSRALKF